MYLIQLLLPLHDRKKAFPKDYFDGVRETLTERFGGVTAFLRSPAVGLWKDEDIEVSRDEVVMYEVISDELDRVGGKRTEKNCRRALARRNSWFGRQPSQDFSLERADLSTRDYPFALPLVQAGMIR